MLLPSVYFFLSLLTSYQTIWQTMLSRIFHFNFFVRFHFILKHLISVHFASFFFLLLLRSDTLLQTISFECILLGYCTDNWQTRWTNANNECNVKMVAMTIYNIFFLLFDSSFINVSRFSEKLIAFLSLVSVKRQIEIEQLNKNRRKPQW